MTIATIHPDAYHAATAADPSLVAPWYSTDLRAYFRRPEDAVAWAERFGGDVAGRVVRLPTGGES